MAVYFVTRHKGAAEWARRHGIDAQVVDHLDARELVSGDTVLGTLPVALAAEVCAKGCRYFNLSLEVPAAMRGEELNVDELEALGARLEEYVVCRKW